MENLMPKNYLWAVGEGLKAYRPGDTIAERYYVRSSRILLDTQPDRKTEVLEEISAKIEAYLKLFAYRLHIPQVYAGVSLSPQKQGPKIWLLENGPISRDGTSLLPELANEWKEAQAMRQLNWLWQIAQLWEPLRVQGVASSLLNSELLRVEGPIVKLLELEQDRKNPSLRQLGKLWQKWLPTARSEIENFLSELCEQTIKGEIDKAEHLIHQLDKGLTAAARSHDRTIHIATGSESGPSRSHNEDACYPNSGTSIIVAPSQEAVAIVCDGIGGQDGGEVASELAINILTNRMQQIPVDRSPNALQEKLEQSARAANDAISDRNDRENRQGRQRMGTTLVMANAREGDLYITHVGDSRAYLITRWGCHQVTLDDDVATREVRLGYAIYRDAVQQVASGALVQALGITSSNHLHPTVQRFPIDEDCIFLLCSDGLSDKDRVEQNWEAEILPILLGETDVVATKNKLIEIANSQNGHDNVTVALIYYQVDPKHDSGIPTTISLSPMTVGSGSVTAGDRSPTQSPQKTVRHQRPSSDKNKALYFLAALLLPALVGSLFYIFQPLLGEIFGGEGNSNMEPSTPPVSAENNSASNFIKGEFIGIFSRATDASGQINPLILFKKNRATKKGRVPSGSIMQVMEMASDSDWLLLKICYIPKTNQSENSKPKMPQDYQTLVLESPNSTQIVPSLKWLLEGETGWIKKSAIELVRHNSESLSSEQQGECF